MTKAKTTREALKELFPTYRVFVKGEEGKEEVILNECFPSLWTAMGGTKSLAKGLAILCKRSVTVNIYYMHEGRLCHFPRFYSLREQKAFASI